MSRRQWILTVAIAATLIGVLLIANRGPSRGGGPPYGDVMGASVALGVALLVRGSGVFGKRPPERMRPELMFGALLLVVAILGALPIRFGEVAVVGFLSLCVVTACVGLVVGYRWVNAPDERFRTGYSRGVPWGVRPQEPRMRR